MPVGALSRRRRVRGLYTILAAFALACLAAIHAGCSLTSPTCSENPSAEVRILVDLIHSRKQNPTLVLDKAAYGYTRVHGYSRLFAHLTYSGFGYDCVSSGTLTRDVLQRYDILFINLVDDTRPRFTEEEAGTIETFVEQGGGLFVITDHSNCYHSAQIINPVLERFDLAATLYTAVELEPESQVEGKGWCKITRFADHPITQGINMISFMTGGTIESTDSNTAVLATTSASSFGDFWNENDDSPGYYGNWSQDAGEPDGPLDVAVAAERGQGRVVVVADQNIFGDIWLHYADNWRFALNAFQWLCKDAQLAREEPRFRILVDELHNEGRAGRNFQSDGYHVFYANLSRDVSVTPHAVQGLGGDWDAVMLISPRTAFDETELAWLNAHLAGGHDLVLILNEADDPNLAQPLLDRYAEGMRLTVGTPAVIEESAPLRGDAGGRSVDLSHFSPVTADQGEERLWVEHGGERYDIARMFRPAQGGRVLVFCQSAFWRNGFLNDTSVTPNLPQLQAWELEWVLLDALTGD